MKILLSFYWKCLENVKHKSNFILLHYIIFIANILSYFKLIIFFCQSNLLHKCIKIDKELINDILTYTCLCAMKTLYCDFF